MASNQTDDGSVTFGGRMPSHVKTAMTDWVRELDYENRTRNIRLSHLYRQGLYELILQNWDEIPSEAKETLDKEELEKQVDGGLGIDL